MTSEQDAAAETEFGDVFGDLKLLADRIDRRRYPGRSWARPGMRSRFRRVLWPVAAAAAIAAGWMILAIVLNRPISVPAPSAPTPIACEAAPLVAPPQTSALTTTWSIPASIHVSGINEMTLDVPRVPAPSSVEIPSPGRLTWSVPPLSSW